MLTAGGEAQRGQATVWGWVERQAGRAATAAAAAADAPALADARLPVQPQEGPPAAEALPLPPSDADFPPLGATSAAAVSAQPPSAASLRRTRGDFWAALTSALGAEPLETDEEQYLSMYLVPAAGGAFLLLEVSLPREGFPAAAPQVALGALDSADAGQAGPAATPPRLRLRWAPHLDVQAAAQRLAEAVTRRAAAWPEHAADSDEEALSAGAHHAADLAERTQNLSLL
jgi:hypothetical protein